MKEKYFKYSLIGLIALLGWLIMSGLWSFVNGLLAAFTVYVLVNGQMTYLTEKRKMKHVFAAILILLEVITCVGWNRHCVVSFGRLSGAYRQLDCRDRTFGLLCDHSCLSIFSKMNTWIQLKVES